MKYLNLQIIYLCTILTLCTLYAVQPIQPVFEQEFALTRFQSVIFTTIIMLPLGFSPILYGYFLETISSKKLLKISVVLLGVLELLFSVSDTYVVLLLIRAIQGLIIPALLTSLMSYIAYISPKDKIQQSMGLYIASTIFGGFIGRMLSGYLTDVFGWRFFFVGLGIALILSFFLLNFLQEDAKVNVAKPSLKQIQEVLKNKIFLYIYLVMFVVFFVFQAVLNFIPFWINSFSMELSNTKVGLVYAGYVIGLIISIKVTKLISFIGSETKSMFIGAIIYIVGIQFFNFESYTFIFFGMFVFCAGMFIIHSIASGYINKLADNNKAISNGLYISFYYLGGVLGSFIPGVIYQNFGWHSFLIILSFIIFIPLWLIFKISNTLKQS